MSPPPAHQCASCTALLAPDATLCAKCGLPARHPCSACGFANRAQAHFCGACGQQLRASGPVTPGTRSSFAVAEPPAGPAVTYEPGCTAEVRPPPAQPPPAEPPLGLAFRIDDAQSAPPFAGPPTAGGLAGSASPAVQFLPSLPSSRLAGDEGGSFAGAGAAAFPLAALSIALAVLAQSVLLRTKGPWPALPLFLVAAALGGWAAARHAKLPAPPPWLAFCPTKRGRGWKVCAAAAAGLNVIALVLFGRELAPGVGWMLYAGSAGLAVLAFWWREGRPALRADWRAEAPWLAALGVLLVAGAALRLIWLDSLPFGLWFDAAYSGLQVERVLSDPAFRPVYVGGLAQEPSLYWYLAVPFFRLFGATPLAIRLPGALASIAAIPAMYLAARELFGRKTGLVAAALTTTLAWNLTFARFAANVTGSVTLDVLGLFFLVRALRKGSWTAAALAGLSLGFGLHMYYTTRLMILLSGFAVLAFWLQSPRKHWPNVWRAVLAAAFAGLIAGSPIAEFAIQHPDEFNSRLQQASVLNEVREQHSYAPLLESAKAHLLMFNLAGDRNARHNLPGEPELNFLLGGLFVLGLGIALARARRPEYLLLPVWALVMLVGGVFSVAFEAPQSLRTIDEVNVIVLLCALPLALVWEAASNLTLPPPRGDLPELREPVAKAGRPLPQDTPAEALPSLPADPPAGAEPTVRAELPAGAGPLPGDITMQAAGLAWLQRAWCWACAHPVLALLPVWTLAALWLTDPLYRHLTSAIPAGFDAPQMLWDLWWTRFALLDLHQSPLYSTYMFVPQEVNLAFHSLMPLSGLISVPVQLTLGLFAAYNFILLGSLVASCAGAYLLVSQETRSRAGAFIGSLVFGFAPYKFAHLGAGHLPAVTSWAVPFFALFFLRWLRDAGRRDAAAAGVFLACAGLTDLNLFALSLLLGAVLAAGMAWRRRQQGLSSASWNRVQGGALLAGISAILMAPLLEALFEGVRHGWPTSIPLSAAEGWSPDLLGYVLPLPRQPWWGALGRDVADRFNFLDDARVVFTGYLALALALLALGRARSNARRWWLVVGLFWLLSLGPMLHLAGASQFRIDGFTFSVPLPFLALHALPVFGGLSNPGYFSLLFMLGLAVLAGHGVVKLGELRRLRPALVGGLGVLVLAESLTTPLELYGPRPEAVYQGLAAEPGHQAALIAPVGWIAELGGDGNPDMSELYYATIAEKPLVSGYVSRLPASYLDYYRKQPALSVLLFPDRRATPESQDAPLVQRTLRQMGVGYVALRRWPQYERQLAYVTQVLGLPRFYDDGQAVAFRVPG